jgi:hypothetical protein
MIESLIARFVATRFGAFVAKVPRGVWLALAIAAALAGLTLSHQHRAHAAIKAADAAGYARAVNVYDRALQIVHDRAAKRRAAIEGTGRKISATIKDKHDAEDARINHAANGLLRDGPGKARCGSSDHPSVPAGVGRYHQAVEPTAAAVAAVPDPRGQPLIGLPFDAAVAAARQADADRNEVIAWRNWYTEQSTAWERYRRGVTKH